MEICFGTQTHIISFPKDCAELQATIVHELPELIPHQEKLQMHYIDDEGDDISVTTDDELQEAINCGSQNGGFLSLKLFVNGLEPKTECKIEETAVQNDDSTEEEEEDYVAVPRRVRAPGENPTEAAPAENTEATDILAVMKNAGVTAVAEINSALTSATTEINKVLDQLAGATTKQQQTKKELDSVKKELAEATSKCASASGQVVKLTHDLGITRALLSESEKEAKTASIRLKDLEKQAAEKVIWENKCKAAEEERDQLDQQLQALRSALQALTLSGKPTPVKASPVTAEVVSNEIIPSSPVVEPAPAPELPPPYKEPEPVVAPAPSPTELLRQQQLKQLREMGFHLTLEQLNEKLEACSGNMEHVIHSLLR